MLVAASGFLSRSLLSGPPVPRARLPARTAVPNDFAAANFRPRSGPRTKAARTRRLPEAGRQTRRFALGQPDGAAARLFNVKKVPLLI